MTTIYVKQGKRNDQNFMLVQLTILLIKLNKENIHSVLPIQLSRTTVDVNILY